MSVVKSSLLSGLAIVIAVVALTALVVKSKERKVEPYEYLFI